MAHDLRACCVLAMTGLCLVPLPARAAETTKERVLGEQRAAAALVYLIRKGRFQGGGRTMFVYADETFLGVLDNGTYTFAYVAPGTHLLWTNWTSRRKEIDV